MCFKQNQKQKKKELDQYFAHPNDQNSQVMQLLHRGNKARTIEPTAANQTSSRSHALLSVTVRQSFRPDGDQQSRNKVKQGRLFMIDLAGSERAKQTKVRSIAR